jgi:glucan 1,3-beta-glucosidase
MVGEWSLATVDCAKWLNGYGTGSRFDGTFPGSYVMGSCVGQDDIYNSTIWTPEYKK